MKNLSATGLVAFIAFLGTIIFIIFQTFDGIRVHPSILLMLIFDMYYIVKAYGEIDMSPLKLSRVMIFDSGAYGTIVKGPDTSLPGGKHKYEVAFFQRYVPDSMKKRIIKYEWLKGLMVYFSSAYIIPIIRHYSDFIPIPPDECEASEGVIRCVGSIAGHSVKSVPEYLTDKLEYMKSIQSKFKTLALRWKSVAAEEARGNRATFEEIGTIIANINRDLNAFKIPQENERGGRE